MSPSLLRVAMPIALLVVSPVVNGQVTSEQRPAVGDSAQETIPTYLTNEELKALFSKTLRLTFSQSRSKALYAIYQQDGTANVHLTSGGNVIGSWRIEGNKFCTTYSRLGSGCVHVQKAGDMTYKTFGPNGQLSSIWEVGK